MEQQNGDAGGGWQPIETAPKDGTPVLFASPNYLGYRIWASKGWKDDRWQGQATRNAPTHWMPLPEPPDAP